MIDPVDHAHCLAIDPGQRCVGRFVGVQHALPGDVRHFTGKTGLVEVQIRLPQGQPGTVIVGGYRANIHGRHSGFLQSGRIWAAS
ncbi:hypothetical protein D3C78_1807450 [compost metagenome]